MAGCLVRLVPLIQAQRVLNIDGSIGGDSNSGLIALMLAQRSAAKVMTDAVELDEAPAELARDNVQKLPWSQRIKV
jgi:tRNA1Val (adenine37-N6)-methyltransferase